jgi:hypothetical protein
VTGPGLHGAGARPTQGHLHPFGLASNSTLALLEPEVCQCRGELSVTEMTVIADDGDRPSRTRAVTDHDDHNDSESESGAFTVPAARCKPRPSGIGPGLPGPGLPGPGLPGPGLPGPGLPGEPDSAFTAAFGAAIRFSADEYTE